MKKIITFISNQGYLIMLLGFCALVAGVLLWLQIYRGANGNVILAWTVSSIGIGGYVTGRIGVFLKNQGRRSK